MLESNKLPKVKVLKVPNSKEIININEILTNITPTPTTQNTPEQITNNNENVEQDTDEESDEQSEEEEEEVEVEIESETEKTQAIHSNTNNTPTSSTTSSPSTSTNTSPGTNTNQPKILSIPNHVSPVTTRKQNKRRQSRRN